MSFWILFCTAQAESQSDDVLIAPTSAPMKLTNLNYRAVTECFPSLANPEFEQRLDLTALNTWFDAKFATKNSELRYRKVLFTEGTQATKKRLTYSFAPGTKKPEYHLLLEKIDDQGLGDVIKLPKEDAVNPKPGVIRSYLQQGQIQEDESLYKETKTNGFEAVVKMNLTKVTELEIHDKANKKDLQCELRTDGSSLCLCLNK